MVRRVVRACAIVVVLAGTSACPVLAQSHGPSGPILAQAGAWTDENGKGVTLASFRGAPFVLSAFFTTCTLKCPMTIQKLQEIDRAYRKHGPPVPIVLLTLDPRNDTPERLQRYRREHDFPDNWRFLRGSDSDTRILARSLHVDPAYDEGHIDHDVRIAVFDAGGRELRAFEGWGFDVEAAIVR
jgi:protein SCO1